MYVDLVYTCTTKILFISNYCSIMRGWKTKAKQNQKSRLTPYEVKLFFNLLTSYMYSVACTGIQLDIFSLLPFFCLQATSCGSSTLSWPLIPMNSLRFLSWSIILNSSFISALCCCWSLSALSFKRIIFAWASSLERKQDTRSQSISKAVKEQSVW